jgi:hypothetical protein
MSQRKYSPSTGVGGHEIRRVFWLFLRVEEIPGSSRGAAQSPSEMPKGGSAGGARRFKSRSQNGAGPGDGEDKDKSWWLSRGPQKDRVTTIEVPKWEKVETPKRMELQTSRSQKVTKTRGPTSGCRAATALHRVGETCAPLGGTGGYLEVAIRWRKSGETGCCVFCLLSRYLPWRAPFPFPLVFSLSLSLLRPSLRSLSLVSDHT